MAAKQTGEPGWTWRRLILIGVIIASFLLLWRLINAPDTAVNSTIAGGLIVSIIAASMIFGGFATVQDVIAIWVTKSALPYSPRSSPAEATPGTPTPPPDAPKEE